MNYVVTIVLVFETDRPDEPRFDLWDIKTPVEADGPGKALKAAVSLSRIADDREAMGYPRAPVLRGVRAVDTPSDPVSEKEFRQVCKINQEQVELLRSFELIYVPYHLIHLAQKGRIP
jgi:hypothetical protein